MELATVLQNTSLQKKDLELELDELESAARMVVEEEQQASSDSSSSASSDSSSSDSSSGSEESETEGQGCFEFKQGGGGRREACKDNPSQPSSFTSPIPHTSSSALFPSENRKADALRSPSQGCRQLIQELGEQMTEELRISADTSSEAETRCSLMSEAAADAEEPSGRSSSSSGGTLLEPNPCTNPLLIVQTHQDQDFIS
ncbi:hypothetical protein XENOCAPTIV_013355 [Xenoophorus captivus]|uniref:Uncharacterized protein n=1 Tax=Xenoophorus captivus TaxID=1517983 RepID=A0ABV0RJ76_9TELE